MFKVTETSHGVGFVRLPKIGRVRFVLSRPLPSASSSVTVIREADGRYYLSFVVDVPAPEALPDTDRVAGVDLGLTDLAVIACSDGTRQKVSNPRWLGARETALARAQRSLARKQRGSRNQDKARHEVAVLHRKVRGTRLDHHHQLALRLVRENQTVVLDSLSIPALTRTRMAKSVHDAGWGSLIRLIGEKAADHGRTVVRIGPWEPTSQVCSVCGTPAKQEPAERTAPVRPRRNPRPSGRGGSQTNYTSALLAAEKGLPVRLVAGNDVGAADHGVYVAADSGLSAPPISQGRRWP